jgi:protein SCO1/2
MPNESRESGAIRDIGRWTLLILFLALAGCEKSGTSAPPAQPLKKLYEVSPFTLTERNEDPFDSQSMRGKVWVANFFFADCQGICPALNHQVAKIHKAFAKSPDVQFVSISTEEKDTPKLLREYATQFGADGRWHFLTGKKDEVFDISVKGFKLPLADAEGVDVKHKYIHSTRLVLMDKQGWVRGYYDGLGEKAEKDAERLIADIKNLLAEPATP